MSKYPAISMTLGKHHTLNRYIASEFLFSFFVSFQFFFLVFFFNQLLLMAQGILAKGIPIGSVLLLILYSTPSFLTLSAPFATMTAALMAYGRFSSDNEILAMRSAGVKKSAILQPVLVLGIAISIVSFGVNDFLLPAGTKAFQRLWVELSLTYPELELGEYSVRRFRHTTFITGAIDDVGIHPMIIVERDNSGNLSSIIARFASPSIRDNKRGFPGFRMHDVLSLTPNSIRTDEWTWGRADYMDYRLLGDMSTIFDQSENPAYMRILAVRNTIREKSENQRKRFEEQGVRIERQKYELSLEYFSLARGKAGMIENTKNNIANDYSRIKELEAGLPVDHSIQIWKLEYYQKFAIPFASLPFVFLAFPLGLMAKRSGRAVGFFIGLLLTTFYWSLLVLGRSLGLRTDASPFLVMIAPEIVLLVIGVGFYLRRVQS